MSDLYGHNNRNSENTGRNNAPEREHTKVHTPARASSSKRGKGLSSKKKAALFVLVLVIVFILVLLSPIFSITDINVSAVSLYSGDEIAASLSDFSGRNGFISLLRSTSFSDIDDIFRLRFGSREKSMLFDYPLIKNVTVKYDPPHTLNVQIEERVPIFVTESDGIYLHVDSEGYLLGAYTQADKPAMPIIEGIEITDYKIGTSISGGKDKTVDEAIKICSLMKQLSMLSYIDIIDISDYNNIWMYCAPSLSIKFGNTDDMGRKLAYIKGIIDSGYDGMSDGTLDMSSGGNPVFKSNDYTGNPNVSDDESAPPDGDTPPENDQ